MMKLTDLFLDFLPGVFLLPPVETDFRGFVRQAVGPKKSGEILGNSIHQRLSSFRHFQSLPLLLDHCGSFGFRLAEYMRMTTNHFFSDATYDLSKCEYLFIFGNI